MSLKSFWPLILLATAVTASATTLPKVELSELYSKADAVVIVQVTQGHTIEVGPQRCGAIYRAQIIRSFKGPTSGQIEFGHYWGYEVGSSYVLFLTSAGHEYAPKASVNSAIESREQEARRLCMPVQTASRVMHSGYGAMRIETPAAYHYRPAVLFPVSHIGLPASVPSQSADVGDLQGVGENAWVVQPELEKALELLAAEQPNNSFKADKSPLRGALRP